MSPLHPPPCACPACAPHRVATVTYCTCTPLTPSPHAPACPVTLEAHALGFDPQRDYAPPTLHREVSEPEWRRAADGTWTQTGVRRHRVPVAPHIIPAATLHHVHVGVSGTRAAILWSSPGSTEGERIDGPFETDASGENYAAVAAVLRALAIPLAHATRRIHLRQTPAIQALRRDHDLLLIATDAELIHAQGDDARTCDRARDLCRAAPSVPAASLALPGVPS